MHGEGREGVNRERERFGLIDEVRLRKWTPPPLSLSLSLSCSSMPDVAHQ